MQLSALVSPQNLSNCPISDQRDVFPLFLVLGTEPPSHWFVLSLLKWLYQNWELAFHWSVNSWTTASLTVLIFIGLLTSSFLKRTEMQIIMWAGKFWCFCPVRDMSITQGHYTFLAFLLLAFFLILSFSPKVRWPHAELWKSVCH